MYPVYVYVCVYICIYVRSSLYTHTRTQIYF